MSETANVRLVRCPKCENLLPEVTDYSVYQCGGCGAVLRAENRGVDLDKLSYKSDEERVGGTVEKLSDKSEKMNAFEKRIMDTSDCSESDVRSTISSSSRGERRILRDGTENHTTKMVNKEEKWDVWSDELHQAKVAQDFEHLAIYNENEEIGLRRSGRVVDGRNVDRSEMEGFWSAQRMDNEGLRYSKDGPSNFLSRSSNDYENPTTNRNDMDGFSNVDYAGEDRAELLKTLDELKDQLSRSGNKNNKAKEKVSLDRRMAHQEPYVSENWYPDAQLGMNRASVQYSYPDTQYKRPPYQNQYAEPPPLMHRQELDGNGFYPPRYPPNHVQGYGDPLRSQMLRRGSHQNSAPYQHQPSHAYMSGRSINDGMAYMDTMEPYPHNVSRHHPSCSCFQCRNKREVPPSVQPTAYSDKFSDVPNNRIYNYQYNHGSFGPREYNRRISDIPSLRSHNSQLHTRCPSDVNSEVDGFIRHRPPRVHLASGGKHCHPIAGGAPFFMCFNCFEMLLLPKKILTQNSDRKKMRCGACSTLIVFEVSDKNLVVLIYVEANDTPVKVFDKPELLSARGDGRLNQARTTFSSDDYDNSGYNFQSMDRELGQLSAGQRRDNRSTDFKNHHSTSTYASEAEEDRESLIAARKDSSSADLPTKDTGPPPPAGSPLRDRFGYSNNYNGVDSFGEGNRSGRAEHDKMFANKASNGQISMKDSTSATEIDILSNEYFNTGTTFDLGEGSREGDRLKGSRAESFFAGIIKKSFRDSNRSNQTVEPEKANVTVNGHLITDRLIKKAEKLAGPIHPGHYWYDFRAGFWGAMGGSCLGIIPPFIPEFNYPIPENCSGGNTRLFVNGRELSQKDLNLLGSRGLPTERDKSYIIEISGRILDEDTGEELESLGKLAPTVEKAKRGFGMRDPRAAADLKLSDDSEAPMKAP